MKLLLFDLHGTILHATHTRGLAPFTMAMREVFGVDVDVRTRRPDGKTDPLIIAKLLDLARLTWRPDADALRAFEECLAMRFAEALAHGPTRVEPIPGVQAMLETLTRDPRFALTVLTGNLERAAHLKLRAAGLDEFV